VLLTLVMLQCCFTVELRGSIACLYSADWQGQTKQSKSTQWNWTNLPPGVVIGYCC